jgi:L-ascorbate metabolism protein UlaG (beta-lactamase superfamily)
MIKITHIGHACFTVDANNIKVVFDPYDESFGLEMPQITADRLFISHEHYDHNNRAAITVKPAAELPISDHIVKSWHDDEQGAKRGSNDIHIVTIDDTTICHLGDLGTVLSDEQITAVGAIDVLMIPVGGTYTIDANAAREVVQQLKPRVTIPMHYFMAGMELDLAPVDEFLRLMEQDGLKVFHPGGNSLDYNPNIQSGVWVI